MSRHASFRWLALPACAALAALAAPLSAVDDPNASFGDQPVAIGAGARALGLGGAFSAIADDATASTWNPAGLTQCERPELAVSLGAYSSDVETPAGDRERQSANLEHLGAMYPFFAGGCMQVVGVAWQRQYDFTRSLVITQHEFDPMGPITIDDSERIDRAGELSSLGLCYAIEPVPGFSLGVTVNTWADRWTRASAYSMDDHSISTTDYAGMVSQSIITQHADTRVLSGTSYVLGSWWQVVPDLTLALVVKPSYDMDLETRSEWTQAADGIPVDAESETIHSTLRHPPSVTLGSAWRQGDEQTVSLDATWTRWRQYRSEFQGKVHSPVNPYVTPDDFDDLWTLRAGYERVLILPSVVLVPRLGAMLEWLPAVTAAPSAATAEQVSATSDRWIGASAGLGICQRQVIWDLAVMLRHGNDVGAGQFAAPDQTADVWKLAARLGATIQF